ncbi:Hsp70 family protein [Glycomyces sp. NPDC046736]|uniref:Hsp70 family protein n=1 Tax=Glycomyces sp. NPDC046736 TaxID=3155615 RepID=UPI0033BFFC2A
MTAIGIDLGTTNSVVARRDPARGEVRVVKVHGRAGTPSVVGLRRRAGSEDEVLVGTPALNWANRDPENTIQSVKRLMGRDFAEDAVAEALARRPYKITAGPGDDPRAHVVMGGQTYSPIDISTKILEHLRTGARDKLGEEITHAVITVPAYFREAQRAATRQAGAAAGLVVKRIIDEPTAAAIAFGLEQRQGDRRRVLVYDLGGGTFDISILNSAQDAEGRNFFQVLDFVGDNWLGGDDFDLLIVDRIIDHVKREHDVDPSTDTKFLFQAKKAAENAKRELTEADSAEIFIEAAFKFAGGTGDVDMVLTRGEFDALIGPKVEATLDLVRSALERQHLSADDISDVLLVGGSTLVPKVAESVSRLFGADKVRRHIDPMECVAIGAGVLAATLNGIECSNEDCKHVNDEAAESCTECGHSLVSARPVGDTTVYDVTGMALGIAALEGSNPDAFVEVIPRGTPYPMSEPLHQSFEATDPQRIKVPVYEGDSKAASQNHEQGLVEVELPQAVDLHTPVDVGFLFDRNRELQVTVSVPSIAFEKHTTLKVDQARATTAKTVEVDEDEGDAHREYLIATIDGTKRFLEVYEQYLHPAQAVKIRADLDRAQEALMFDDKDECKRMVDVLNRDVFGSGLATQLYLAERAAAQANTDEARSINDSIARLQQAHLKGNATTVHEQSRALNAMVNKVHRENAAVQQIEDADDLGGILRKRD